MYSNFLNPSFPYCMKVWEHLSLKLDCLFLWHKLTYELEKKNQFKHCVAHISRRMESYGKRTLIYIMLSLLSVLIQQSFWTWGYFRFNFYLFESPHDFWISQSQYHPFQPQGLHEINIFWPSPAHHTNSFNLILKYL